MQRSRAREWLARLLEGQTVDAAGLDKLLEQCPEEDQWLEYKSGAVIEKRKQGSRGRDDSDQRLSPAEILRKYVTGFANADGGLLAIGVKQHGQPPRFSVDGATPPGGGSLSEWAARALTGVPVPPPRLAAVDVERDGVLLVATPRARSLVPCVESGLPTYYYRIGDQTVEMPQSLLYDLMLGRRSEAELSVSFDRAEWRMDFHDVGPNVSQLTLEVRLSIENRGLTFSDDVRAGLVAWCIQHAGVTRPTSALIQSVDAPSPDDYEPVRGATTPWTLAHVGSYRFAEGIRRDGMPLISLGPFDATTRETIVPWPIPVFHDFAKQVDSPDPLLQAMARGRVRLRSGLYVVARGSEPWWYQVEVEYDSQFTGKRNPTELARLFRVTRLYSGRPEVSLSFV